METFYIPTMTQILSWWSWFSLWWTVEWLARHCSLTSEVIHSSCCQKGSPAIIGLWLCNIWNNQQRRRQILLLVSGVLSKLSVLWLLFTIHISQHNLLGSQLFVWKRMIPGKRWTEWFILDTWQCQCLNQETILCNLMMRYYIKIYGLAHWCAIQCNFWWSCASELDINLDFHKIKIDKIFKLKTGQYYKTLSSTGQLN